MHSEGVGLSGEGVGHRFGPRILFRRMDFSLMGGTSTAIVGSNGSGKSTFVRILAGLLTPTAGSVQLRLDGRPVERARQPLHCGMVAPYLNVYDGLTPRENLSFIADARRLTGRDKRVQDVLGVVGLEDRADDPVSTFSSGMIQRVRVACALLPDPSVLLLDEPGATLDDVGLAMMQDVIRTQTEQGRIVVVATNVAAEADLCGSRIDVTAFR